MVVKIGKSRRLFLLMGICLIDTHSTPSDLIPLLGNNKPSQDPFDGHTLWIVDENSGQCLSSYGFGACGDVNLWKWRSNARNNELVMFESVLPPRFKSDKENKDIDVLKIDGEEEEKAEKGENEEGDVVSVGGKNKKDSLCLGRMMSISKTHPETTLSKCSSRIASATTWEYDHENMMLSTATGVLSKFMGSLCVVRDGDVASTQNCNMGYSRLQLVIHTTRTGEPTETEQNTLQQAHSKAHPIENGEWICQKSGLVFPRNLDGRVPSLSTKHNKHQGKHEDRQIFMGAGIFTKTVLNYDFKVYTVGWYVEAQGARKDPYLRAFEGLSANELATSNDFYEVMTRNSQYDRTIFIKLAMALQTDLMIRGLVEELQISPKNSKLLSDASRAYEPKDCPKGLEVLLTWRYARLSNNNRDILEIRIGGTLYSSLDEPGLAQDFFQQFVQQDPVSVRAKLAFVDGFPALLSAHQNSPKSSEVIKNLKKSDSDGVKRDEGRRSNKRGFSLFRRKRNNEVDVVESGGKVSWRDGLTPSFYALAERSLVWWKGSKIDLNTGNTGKYKAQVDSLLINQRETKMQEELIATVLIFFYLILLLILSLPPAMIKRGKRVVAIVKRKIEKIQVAIKRTVSCTSLCTPSLCSASQSFRQSVEVVNAMT